MSADVVRTNSSRDRRTVAKQFPLHGKEYPKGEPKLQQAADQGKPNLQATIRSFRCNRPGRCQSARPLPSQTGDRETAGGPLPPCEVALVVVAARSRHPPFSPPRLSGGRKPLP